MEKEYNKAIDFIKGFAAFSVIFLHTLSEGTLKASFAVFHIWQAVPLFLLISFYLGFGSLKRNGLDFSNYFNKRRIKKLFIRLWIPLIIMAIVQSLFFCVVGVYGRVPSSLLCIGNGPGSYYIWCYMQVWLLIPILYCMLLRTRCLVVTGGVILIFSMLGNYIWERNEISVIGFTCFRYLFLAFIAYIVITYPRKLVIKRFAPLGIVSMLSCWYLVYKGVPSELNLFEPDGWSFQTSISYFYTLFLFLFLEWLHSVFEYSRIVSFIRWAGKHSWEIFIGQMFWIGSGFNGAINRFIANPIYGCICSVTCTLVISICFAILYNFLFNKATRRNERTTVTL